jgi:hypothetical protein
MGEPDPRYGAVRSSASARSIGALIGARPPPKGGTTSQADDPRKSSWTGIYRINRMMRFIVGANPFARKALSLPAGRRMNSPLHQAQLPFLARLSLFASFCELTP